MSSSLGELAGHPHQFDIALALPRTSARLREFSVSPEAWLEQYGRICKNWRVRRRGTSKSHANSSRFSNEYIDDSGRILSPVKSTEIPTPASAGPDRRKITLSPFLAPTG